jgi:hypothetical protein
VEPVEQGASVEGARSTEGRRGSEGRGAVHEGGLWAEWIMRN